MKKVLVFISLTAVAGVASMLSGTRSPAPTTRQMMVQHKVLQFDGDEVIEYPSIEDAAIISNVPEEIIMQSIITQQAVDGYVFRHQ